MGEESEKFYRKKSDLETYSQVRATIIASYIGGPETQWRPQTLFSSPKEIYDTIPPNFSIPHVRQNGTLLVERRWVDSELPEMEILEALAYVYGRLADMVVSLYKHNKISISNLILDRRPNAMGKLAMDRGIYLSMMDGSLTGSRYFLKSADIPKKSKIARRYGKNMNWDSLKEARSLRDVAEGLFNLARVMIFRDGHHHSVTIFLKGTSIVRILITDHPDRAARYVMMRDLAILAKIDAADGIIMIGEAWLARQGDIPESGFAVDAKNRQESLILHAANSKGEIFVFESIIERRKNSNKIKLLSVTSIYNGGFQFILYPFLKEWGCVNEKQFQQAIDNLESLGVKTPEI